MSWIAVNEELPNGAGPVLVTEECAPEHGCKARRSVSLARYKNGGWYPFDHVRPPEVLPRYGQDEPLEHTTVVAWRKLPQPSTK